ncbi:TIGR01777 family oxidoreductase [Alkalihalobacillus sp. 1P02AB]|uniref:TIGR01777 family oxidoreductase n=1 Tax=Alkalihalobacillus sp. 1P02AB TaxID=3132260 RepID=UPI0039A436A1
MNIAITGGTGFIGSRLVDYLLKEGHQIKILTRSLKNKEAKEGVTYIKWLSEDSTPAVELEGIEAIYHLAGESIGAKRWSTEQKQKILNSRIDSTNELLSIISKMEQKPKTLISASAIGYYGNSESETFTEKSKSVDNKFLTSVVQQWEEQVAGAREFGIRTVFCRLGIVLHANEGALNQMLLPYRLFIGGPLGTGNQWFSWIHIDDVIDLFAFVLLHEELTGPINLTSPHPKQMKEFGKILGSVLNRPHWIPVPGFALKILLGDMSTLVLDGQKVLPEQALKHGYSFKFPNLNEALTHLLQK